jgi:hypothetical protein
MQPAPTDVTLGNLLLVSLQLAALWASLHIVRILPQEGSSRFVPPAGVITICVALSAYVFLISEPALLFSDLRKAYYPAALAVLDGPAALRPVMEHGVGGFVNLPIVAYLFSPLALMDVKWASLFMLALGAVMTYAAWLLLAKAADLKGRERWALLVLFAANGPLLNSIREGNTSHMVLLPLVAGYLLLNAKRSAAAGILFALCALIKLPLLLLGPYLVLRRHWQAVAAFSLVLALSGLLSIAIFGWDLHRHWLEVAVFRFGSNPISAFNVQSVPSFIARLSHGTEFLYDWETHPGAPLERVAGTLLVASMLAGAFWACANRSFSGSPSSPPVHLDDSKSLEFSIVVTLAAISSPLSWTHYYCWFLIPAAFFLRHGSPITASPRASRMAWIVIFLVTPAIVFLQPSSPLGIALYAKFAVSYLLFAGFLWYLLLVWARARLTEPSRATIGSS